MKMLNEIIAVQQRKSNILTYVALFIGIALLLISAQLYIDTYHIMNNKQIKNDKYDYLVMNKNITNAMMGNNASAYFTAAEIEALRNQPVVKKIGLIESNHFPIEASNFGELAFSTQLFFESIPAEYLDVNTDQFNWQLGSQTIPVILSQDFLNLYNFGFALSQGLPQMSEETVKALSFNIEIGQTENYTAEVVGFSQRYSSVIVPQSFMQYANAKFGMVTTKDYSRLVIQTEEADNPQLVKYIRDHNYSTQNEKIKWSKIKTVVGIVFASSSFIGIFILALCILLLIMYLNLMITKAAAKLQLLSLLGYKTSILQQQFTSHLFKSFLFIVILAFLVTAVFNVALAHLLAKYQLVVSPWPSWQIILLTALLPLSIYYLFRVKAKKIIQQYLA